MAGVRWRGKKGPGKKNLDCGDVFERGVAEKISAVNGTDKEAVINKGGKMTQGFWRLARRE
jgi:hypothetical protein